MGQIPATEALGSRYVPIRRLRKTWVVVVGHTYRIIYITSPVQNLQNLENLPRTTPGSQNLALARRNGPNPSDRSIGKSMCAHKAAMEDKCDSSWAYLSNYLYHQPRPEPSKIEKSAQNDPREPKPCPCAITTRPNLGPSAKKFVYTYSKVAIWFISVVEHTYRVIYHQPAQNLQKIKICPERPTGAIIDDREGQNGPNPRERSLDKLLCVHINATEDKSDNSWAYLSNYIYHQPRPESRKSRKSVISSSIHQPAQNLQPIKILTSLRDKQQDNLCPKRCVPCLHIIYAKVAIWSIAVVGHPIELCVSPAPSRTSKICPTPPGDP